MYYEMAHQMWWKCSKIFYQGIHVWKYDHVDGVNHILLSWPFTFRWNIYVAFKCIYNLETLSMYIYIYSFGFFFTSNDSQVRQNTVQVSSWAGEGYEHSNASEMLRELRMK